MKKINQTVIDKGIGNCLQAAVASLFDLELCMVPNFILYSDESWTTVFNGFIWSIGWEWVGHGYPAPFGKEDNRHIDHRHSLTDGFDVNGYIDASVPSRSFKGSSHAVIIDIKGNVVHDPNPSKAWEGINVLESGDLNNWTLFKKREDFKIKNLIRI